MQPQKTDTSLQVVLAEESQAELLAYLDGACFLKQWDVSSWQSELNAAEVYIAFCKVATQKTTPVGYISLGRAGDVVEIRRLGTLPEYRHRGIAKTLVRYAIQQMQQWPQIESLLLEVSENNEAALALYQGLGFHQYNKRKAYYEDGSSAICMLRKTPLP